ncbi:MAG TPA: right-handed parallel beta-helix repeat-containing protein, partial [Gemmatimonadales bacterium]|nr:right-handed parallel beta-helix repeat-containing protein [Gemmatimonadales bacterium]
AMDLAQPWGSLRFDDTPAQPSTISHAVLDHGSLGAIGLSDTHVLQVDNSTITEMTGLGVRIVAPGSFVHTTTISNIDVPGGGLGARLGSPTAPSAVLEFSARVTNTGGVSVEAASAVLTACEIANGPTALFVQSGTGTVSINGCNITGNVLGIHNTPGNASVDATGNWWGSAAGPSGGTNIGPVDASGWLGGAVPLGY